MPIVTKVLCGYGGLRGEPSLAVRQVRTQALPERARALSPTIDPGPVSKGFLNINKCDVYQS